MPILMIIGFIYAVKKGIEFDKKFDEKRKEYMACMEELYNRRK